MKLHRLLLPPAFFYLFRSVKRKIRKKYQIEDYSLTLSSGHTLPDFQKDHKLYDRFLPCLTKYLSVEQTIIDVGANIGDTAFLIRSSSDAKIVCVEGSEKFFGYLVDNINSLPVKKGNNINCIHALVGTQNNKGSLKHINGTAKVVKDDSHKADSNNSMSLNEIAKTVDNLTLVKVDTDGFDYDVLISGLKSISKEEPILFWENVIENEDQLKSYNKMYQELSLLGYTKIYIFDNFGNILLSNTSFDSQNAINEYIYSNSNYGGTKTFGYTDTLAVTSKHSSLVDKAISDYKKNYIYAK